MKAILEFQIPEDNLDYNLANKAPDLAKVIYDLYIAFRDHRKYDGKPVTEDTFWKILNDHNVTLDMLL